MRRLIDANGIAAVAERAYDAWNLAMATADGKREINLVYKMQELCKAVKAVADNCPTVDAVEVVRCKNCARCFKHTTKRNRQMMWICMRNEMNVCVRPDDFCSYGERRTDG